MYQAKQKDMNTLNTVTCKCGHTVEMMSEDSTFNVTNFDRTDFYEVCATCFDHGLSLGLIDIHDDNQFCGSRFTTQAAEVLILRLPEITKEEIINDKIQYQINTSVLDCEARIENGAEIEKAFEWLNEELALIYKGNPLHEEN